MKKEKFIQKFVLRTMTKSHVAVVNTESEDFMLEWAISLANKAWDAMQSSENPTDIIALAQKAVRVSRGAAKWLAIDADGEVNAFDIKPSVDQHSNDVWCPFDPYSGPYWGVANVHPPADFTQECYEIAAILGA